MKFWSMLTIVILAFFDASVLSAAQRLSIIQPAYNFGTILQGKKVEHVFVVVNSGDMPLSIKSVKPACGCTAANVSSSVIHPGKSTEIKVTFNSGNFAGAIHKTVALETDDPTVPVSTLTLTGSVLEEIAVTPRQINLGALKSGSTKEVAVTVANHGKRTTKLVSVKSPMLQIDAKPDKQNIKPDETATIKVTATPRSEDRMLSGYLSITTDNPGKPEIIVPIYGSVIK
jgi:Protein of unknown function (DUF1573)